MMEKRILFNGMDMYVYNPKSKIEASFEDINRFLKRFQISGSLNVICKIANKINWENDGQGIIVNGVPITLFFLAYIAMKIIENGFDYKSSIITLDDITKVIDMYYRIPEPLDDEDSLHSCLIRFGSAEFDYQREMKNILPRTVLIYEKLWESCPKTTIKIKSEIVRLFELSIHEMALLAIAYYGRSQIGFITPYNEKDIEIENQDLLQVLTEEKQLKFLYRFSATYSEFRSMLQEEKINNPLLEKFRFNPLLKKPIIIPDINPIKDVKVFLVPIPKLIVEQVTRGLFFYLSDAYKGQGSSNIFRTEFGYVFQDYVGLILQNSLKKWEVLPEWVYDERNSKRTPDWLLISGNKAIFIEVKQATIYMPAKTSGDLEKIKSDLSKTIGHGVLQLIEFESDWRTKKYDGIKKLDDITHFEWLIVTYDKAYYGNWILKKQIEKLIQDLGKEIPENFYWHTISIEELEYFVGMYEDELFEILVEKRLDDKDESMDFREFMAKKEKGFYKNPYLESVYEDFFKKYGIGD